MSDSIEIKVKEIPQGASEIVISGYIGNALDKSSYNLIATVYDSNGVLIGSGDVCPMPC